MKICHTCQQTYSDDVEFCPRDGAQLTAQATETEAQLASQLSRRFRIVRRLGQGGMGAVFLAEQIAVGNRRVALKVLSRKLLDDPDFLLRFQNEAGSTGRIHHANVVTIYESGQADDGTPYIAMEFLEGESLRQALSRRGALPVAEVAEILQQAARGLNAAHKLGIIHRDLKPDNIFLTYPDDESVARVSPPANDLVDSVAPVSPPAARVSPPANVQVKIVDFGIAKLRESGAHTQTGMVLGTPAYMSFEQASGMRSDELDARSDVYSLGVVTYEMLTGRTPFHSDTAVGYLRMHMQEDPPPFCAVKPDLPSLPQLESVVMKALTKDRDQRYGSVLDFAGGFAQAAAAGSEPAVRPEPQQKAVKPQPTPAPKTIVPTAVRDAVAAKPVPQRPQPSRRKWLVVGSIVFMLAVATAGLWYWARSGLRPAQRQVESSRGGTSTPLHQLPPPPRPPAEASPGPPPAPIITEPFDPRIQFTASALWTDARKHTVRFNVWAFDQYVSKYGIVKPPEVLPLFSITEGTQTSFVFLTPPNPPFDQRKIPVATKRMTSLAIRKSYGNYVFDTLLGVDAVPSQIGLARESWIYAEYFARSSLNEAPPTDSKSFDGWLSALWEIRISRGRELADRALLFGIKAPLEYSNDLNKHFRERLEQGVLVVTDTPERIEIDKILERHGLLR